MVRRPFPVFPPPPGRPLPPWLHVCYALGIAGFLVAGGLLGVLVGYQYNLPRIQSLEDFRPDVITDVYGNDSKVIGEFAVERRIIVGYDDIPPYMINAILAAEDDQFFNHSGVNFLSILRALYKDVIAMRKAEGASTITQQLARLLLLSPEKVFDRKIKEMLLAWKIERRYSKRQILTLYCNQIYLGQGLYGIAAAADGYLGKQLRDLTLDECALIAGLPRNHVTYSPRLHPQNALSRRNYILDRMVAERMVSGRTAGEAKSRPLVLRAATRDDETAPHFVEWVRQALADRYTTDAIWRKGLRVYTTLDPSLQRAATAALREGLRSYDKRRGWRGPIDNILKNPAASLQTYAHPDWRHLIRPGDLAIGLVQNLADPDATVRLGRYVATVGPKEIEWTRARSAGAILKAGDLAWFQVAALDEAQGRATVLLEQVPEVQGALITVENSTGEIKAMLGGYDFQASEFNRATQAMRQVGSTFKPIVYSTALESGMTADTAVVDAPIGFTDGLGRAWRPQNYDGKFKGPITVRQILAESRNVPTIKVASLVGIKNVLLMARRFGLAGPMEPYLPLAIGACEATPLEMAVAFTVFPNLGLQPKPYFIRRIEDYDHAKKEETAPRTRRVLEPAVAEQMLRLLENVAVQGTAAAAGRALHGPIGGKTGTTNDFTDAWFVGFTPSLTTAVWVGYDAKKSLGDKQAGGVVALPIWIRYMDAVLKDRPVEQFPTVEATGDLVASSTPAGGAPAGAKKLFVEEIPGTAPPVKRP